MLVKNTDFNEQLVISHCLLCVASTCDAARFCVIRFSAEQSPSLSSVSSVKKNRVLIICLLEWAQHWLLIIRLLIQSVEKNIKIEHGVLLFWFPLAVLCLHVDSYESDHENPYSSECVMDHQPKAGNIFNPLKYFNFSEIHPIFCSSPQRLT